jgi:hypothetical protein
MTTFKSNLPKGWDLNKHYSPILSDYDKKVRSDKVKQIAAERGDEYYEKLHAGIANRDNTYQAECNARPEVQAKISKSMKGKKKSKDHLSKVAAKNKERSKPITTPWGNYESRLIAIKAGKEQGISNPGGKIDKWVKIPNSGFYYKDTE